MVQVLIFGAVLSFGGYDKAEAKILQGRSLFNLMLSVQCAVMHVSAIVDILPGYRGSVNPEYFACILFSYISYAAASARK